MSIIITTKDQRVEFGITRFPDRVNKCLFVARGSMIEPLAYFRSDDDADRFEKILDLIYELLSKEKA